jgi:hypothetical protein
VAPTTVAFLRIRHGKAQSHREWMTRSYALIVAAVTLRLYSLLLEAVFGEYNGYAIVAWACWVPNLLFAEWLIRSKLRRHREARKMPAWSWDGLQTSSGQGRRPGVGMYLAEDDRTLVRGTDRGSDGGWG